MITNAAFEFLRQHKDVPDHVEQFVMKRIKGRVTNSELINVFENGISGQYGKIYTLDAQTLLAWVEKFESQKNSKENYLESALLDPNTPSRESWDWARETNKCYHSFLKGVSCENFHPCVYDNLLLEGKIELEAYQQYYKFNPELDYEKQMPFINRAKQRVVGDVFGNLKRYGYTDIFTIRKMVD